MKKHIIFNLSLIFFFLLLESAIAQSLIINPEYLSFIQQRINSYLVYPPEAQIKGWEGIVRVKFTFSQDGQIKEIAIVESSGYPLLDETAISAVKDASPYPFPKDLGKEELEIILPINYVQTRPTQTTPSEEPFPAEITPIQPPQETQAQIQPSPKISISQPLEGAPQPPVEPSAQITDELTSFVGLALKNNQPTQLAREEIELAQIKITEAQRNLFPKLKLSNYTTTGEVYKIDYEEKEFKVEVGQPLYYSGRLMDTFKQAKTNLEITQKNYDRLKLDVMHKTETAYYNLVATKMNLQEKEALRQEAKELLEKVRRLAEAEMIIPLELSSATSWYKQLEFQINSIKHDLSMAELTFKQVLNVKEALLVKVESLEVKKLDLDLDNYIEVALKNRPEIYLSQLLVKFNDYGRKIEASKKSRPTIDLISSYGWYDGHYKTEPWRPSDNWYIGFKSSMPWGASTFNSSYTTEATQPRFGQTSPTKSRTLSSDFELLDNLKRLSDKKRADIDLKRSVSDLNETTKTIAFEVEDAFLNYQKATLQLETAQADMEFRRNEVDVMKIRAMVGEVSISNALEALYNFSEAQTKYLQALANYQIFIVNLKKACGYGLKI